MTLFNSGGQVVIAKSQSVKVVKVSSKGIPEATRLAASQVSLGASLLHANSFRLCNRTRCAIMVIEKVLWVDFTSATPHPLLRHRHCWYV